MLHQPLAFFRNLARNSPWLVMAIAIHVILGGIAAIAVMRPHTQQVDEAVTSIHIAAPRDERIEEVVQPHEVLDRKAVPKNEDSELVTFEEDVYIPTTDEAVDDLHLDRGDPSAIDNLPAGGTTGGTSIGVGSGGHYGTGKPSPFSGRRVGTGIGKGRGGGATQGTEKAVLEGLRWLARHQNDDGSWGAQSFATHCTTDPPCMPRETENGAKFDVGMTALSLLAFLGQGISVDSKIEIVDTAMGRKRSGGEIVRQGIKWLVAQQKADGSFSTASTFEFPENDTLPTMAMCEAFGLSHNRSLKRPAQHALDFLVAAQKRNADGTRSGWGPGSHADLVRRRDLGEIDAKSFAEQASVIDPTVTSWVVMAMQSARLCGLDVPNDVLPGALAYVVEATGKDDSAANVAANADDKFVYHKARHRALGMLTRTFAGGPISDPYLERGACELADDPPEVTKDGLSVDFYYWYFGTLALNQYDGPDSPRAGSGKYWTRWNKGLVDSILPLQHDSSKRDDCARGGWLQMTRGNRKGLELRNTALNIMTLEVYYRFDNVFGATTRGKE